MNLNSIKNIATSNCCFDINQNPIQVGDMVCFSHGTVPGGGSPVYTAIVDKIKCESNKIHVISKEVGSKVYLRANHCLNVSKLFNINVVAMNNEIVEAKNKLDSEKIITKQIMGLFIDKSNILNKEDKQHNHGIFELLVNSQPGSNITKEDIISSIEKFKADSNIEILFILNKDFQFIPYDKHINPFMNSPMYGYFNRYYSNINNNHIKYYKANKFNEEDYYPSSSQRAILRSYKLTDVLFFTHDSEHIFGESVEYYNNMRYSKQWKNVLEQYLKIFKKIEKNY